MGVAGWQRTGHAQVPAFFIRTSRSCFSDIELSGCVGVLYDNEEIDRRHRHQQLERASHLSALVETTTLNQWKQTKEPGELKLFEVNIGFCSFTYCSVATLYVILFCGADQIYSQKCNIPKVAKYLIRGAFYCHKISKKYADMNHESR